ncbi:MAG: EamA family transporter [Acidimicrobiales bacterium]
MPSLHEPNFPSLERRTADSTSVIALLYAGLSGLSYGAADFSGALATKRNDAMLVTIAMQIVSLGALAVLLYWFVDGVFVMEDMWWGGLGGLGAALGLVTFYKALADGPMTTAASVTALVGSLVPITAGLALGEVPNPITLSGIGLAVPAAVLVSVGALGVKSRRRAATPRSNATNKSQSAKTRMLSVVAGLGFGLFFVALAQTSADGGLFPLVGARIASIGALTIVLSGTARWGGIARRDWASVIVAGVLDFAANSFYLLAIDTGSFTWVAAVSSLYPVATVLLARVVLRERIAPVQVGGLALAAGALVLIGVGAT